MLKSLGVDLFFFKNKIEKKNCFLLSGITNLKFSMLFSEIISMSSHWRIAVKRSNGEEKEFKDTASFDIQPEMFDNFQQRRNEIFRRQQVLRNQRLESEFGIKTGGFKCTNCGKMYNQQASLWRHSKYECGKGPQFQCPYCALKVTQKCYMRKHILRRHADKVFNYTSC